MKRVRRVITLIVAATVGLMLVAFLSAKKLLYVESGVQQADAIVIMGGEGAERIFRALELFKKSMAPSIIVAGSGDCLLIRDRLMLAGVPSSSITLESKSESTKENAELAARLLKAQGARKVIIVTSWFHSRRALSCFRFFAPEIVFFSAPAYHGLRMPSKPSVSEAIFIFEEYFKIIRYAVQYGIWPWETEASRRVKESESRRVGKSESRRVGESDSRLATQDSRLVGGSGLVGDSGL